MRFAEVILPLPIQGTFTYAIPAEMQGALRVGHRVIVPFGRKKFYTAVVASFTETAPQGVEVKEITMMADAEPIVRHPQIQLWEWIADYYLCTVGEVYKAALPAGLKVESETFIETNPDAGEIDIEALSEREAIIMHVLDHASKRLTIAEIEKATGFTGINALVLKMLEKGYVIISEKLVERYRTKKLTYVRVAIPRFDNEALREAFDAVHAAKKQERAFMTLLEMSGFNRRGTDLAEITQAELMEKADVTQTILAAMAKKGIIEIYKKEINRFKYTGGPTIPFPELSVAQKDTLDVIHRSWNDRDITLLHGVTSSGKTEIYMHLIDFVLRQGRQALYLVPEIALTTQLTTRLQRVFGDKVVIYHSKFSDNERVDIWRKLLHSAEPCVVIGARSSIFLPFAQLGLVIVDEEHETSYKQQDPAPRYNGRDAALVLARMHGAKTLLGSATPSIDTYYKALSGRYGLATLLERFGNVSLPEMKLVDISKARFSGQMKGIFSNEMVKIVNDAITSDGQAILFLNRRGYAPVAVCKMCGWIPKCEHCDVSLTYHKRIDKLVCHYCGTPYPLPTFCPACKEPSIEVVGYGTERVEDEVIEAFENARVARMDLDTTRNKDGYENIINDFSERKFNILVGTQMVTKGLDFDSVKAVGIINADSMINLPDFRASERAFNLMEQVSGRAGRRESQGTVAVQTLQPEHPIFNFVMSHDYDGFYKYEIEQRRKFAYPPFTRLIYIYIKHRDAKEINHIATEYANYLRKLFGNRVLGPEEPVISRIQTFYIRKIMLKVEVNASMKKVKEILRNTFEMMHKSNSSAMRSALVYYDVDPY